MLVHAIVIICWLPWASSFVGQPLIYQQSTGTGSYRNREHAAAATVTGSVTGFSLSFDFKLEGPRPLHARHWHRRPACHETPLCLRLASTNRDQAVIQSMSESLTRLVTSRIKETRSGNSSTANAWKPVKMQFSTTHTELMALQDPDLAMRYMSLPLERYSVLDSSVVTRDINEPGVFTVDLPLDSLNTGYALATDTDIFQLPSRLRTRLYVNSLPEQGRLSISSGELFFTYPNQHTDHSQVQVLSSETLAVPIATEDSSVNNTGVADCSQVYSSTESLKVSINGPPKWLVWGDKSDVSRVNGTDVDIKSSVQAAVTVEVTWDHRAHTSATSMRSVPARSARWLLDRWRLGSGQSNSKSIDDLESNRSNATLPVKAVIKVNVEANLPLKGNVAAVVDFFPIKLLITQLGAVLASSILRVVASAFANKLIADYQRRKFSLLSDTEDGVTSTLNSNEQGDLSSSQIVLISDDDKDDDTLRNMRIDTQ